MVAVCQTERALVEEIVAPVVPPVAEMFEAAEVFDLAQAVKKVKHMLETLVPNCVLWILALHLADNPISEVRSDRMGGRS